MIVSALNKSYLWQETSDFDYVYVVLKLSGTCFVIKVAHVAELLYRLLQQRAEKAGNFQSL